MKNIYTTDVYINLRKEYYDSLDNLKKSQTFLNSLSAQDRALLLRSLDTSFCCPSEDIYWNTDEHFYDLDVNNWES